MASPRLPVPNSTTSFWRSEPHQLDDHRSTPELPPEVDIAVIGAGYAGASVVHHLLSQRHAPAGSQAAVLPSPSIIILEARQACSGATGRNGGHMKPEIYLKLANGGGLDAIVNTKFEVANLRAVKQLVESHAIDCDFVLTRAVDALMTDDLYENSCKGVSLLKDYGFMSVADDIHLAKGRDAELFSGIKGVKGCLTYTTAHLSPYKLVMHLLSQAVQQGVNLQTNTPVTAVSETLNADGHLSLSTPRGIVRAKKVVYATNAYTSSLLPEFANNIVPVRGICSHITVPSDKPPPPLLSNSYILRFSGYEYEYLIPRTDGGIILGGSRSTHYHDLESWYDNTEDDKVIESSAQYFDGYMQRWFRGWEDSGARLSKMWSGIMGYSSDGWPHVGAVPGREKQFIVAGFTGHGMPQAFLSAKYLASMLFGEAEQQPHDHVTLPPRYKTSEERLHSQENDMLDAWEATQLRGPSAQ